MYTFLARQPIFDDKYNVYGYELLYRDADQASFANVSDGNVATKRVLSDAITLFGLNTLTDSKPAFVNFTEELILEEFPTLADPKDIVVELLEDVKITPKIIEKVAKLKSEGYTIALDDYSGDPNFDEILPYTDILKVDFMLTEKVAQENIAKKLGHTLTLLAEKVETNEEYEWAKSMGYKLFQGYFFSRPVTYKKKTQRISLATSLMLMAELGKENVDFAKCCSIIRTDTVLTYKLLQKMSTVEYFRGRAINKVENAFTMMGVSNLRRWLLLVVARGNNKTGSDELARLAFLRGLFAESSIKKSSKSNESESAFLMGMFSLLDKILDEDKEKLLEHLVISEAVRDALWGKAENIYSQLLDFIIDYENQRNRISLQSLGINVSEDELLRIYANCVAGVDATFSNG